MQRLPQIVSPGMWAMRGNQILGIVGLIESMLHQPIPTGQTKAFVNPIKMHLVNTATGEDIGVLFNPTEITRALAIRYSNLNVLGLGHQPQNYIHTKNQIIRFTLVFRELEHMKRQLMLDQMRFIESLAYPRRVFGKSAAPPPVLLVWPNYISITATMREWQEVPTQFVPDTMEPISAAVSVEFHELRRDTLTSSLVRKAGGRR